ncbi:MAG: hypothetical protein JW852_06710, partial [Spirochaetales bacterium]|nr:hypothetical protein [Spirochaetales bacterium]
ERLPMVFRISALLKRVVNASDLQNAVDQMMPRFPYYTVRLRSGFFWHYLEENPARVLVRPETDSPCKVLPDDDGNGYLFRIQAYKRRIAVEFSHILTDGTGALVFLKSLVARYLEIRGCPAENSEGILRYDETPDPEEFEDAYARYNSGTAPKPERLEKAFRLPYPLQTVHRYTCLTGECSSEAVVRLAKERNVSVTEYLAGVYLLVLQDIFRDLPEHARRKSKKTLRVQIPINLRKLYPTKTMRNFTLFITPGIDLRLGWYDLDDIIRIVHAYMQNETDVRHIARQLARNQNPERNLLIRSMPSFVKDLLLHTRYTNWGPTQYSGVLTNLGKIQMPHSLAAKIESFTFVPPPGRELRVHGAVTTFGDRMRITFGNVTDVAELQRRFFSFLVENGVHVKVYRYEDV